MHVINIFLLTCLCSTGQALHIIKTNLEPYSDTANLEFQHACEIGALFQLNSRKCSQARLARRLAQHVTPFENKYNAQISKVAWNQMPTAVHHKPWAPYLVCLIRESPPAIGWVLPKVASSSLRLSKTFQVAGFKESFCSSFFADKSKTHWLTDPDVVRFSVVRDPFGRFVSSFNQISFEGLAMGRSSRTLLRPNPAKDPQARFSEFIDDVLVKGRIHESVFIEMQTLLLLEPMEGKLRLPKLNFITSLETLEADLPDLHTLLTIGSNITKEKHIAYPGSGGSLTTENATKIMKENNAAAQAFCNTYVADYVFLAKPLPNVLPLWCPPVSQRSLSLGVQKTNKMPQQKEDRLVELAKFMNTQAVQIMNTPIA